MMAPVALEVLIVTRHPTQDGPYRIVLGERKGLRSHQSASFFRVVRHQPPHVRCIDRRHFSKNGLRVINVQVADDIGLNVRVQLFDDGRCSVCVESFHEPSGELMGRFFDEPCGQGWRE